MGTIKEYVDRAVQTQTNTAPSPYTDPAVVLAAPPIIRRGVAQEAITGHNNLTSVSSPVGSDSTHVVPQSPISPMLAPLVSRRFSRRIHSRCPGGEIMNRRIVSMPENKSDVLSDSHGKRVVSMPDRIRPVLEPSAELFQSLSTAAGDSFRSYNGRRERVRVFHAPSDIPQTPSPPSSPESLLIIASGTQLPEGFLRRKYPPNSLIEEEEDWIAWASSPPRPIPALHGPLSLPYARCPSGAEGTIIEEQDNVAQMIWGLGPDDQPHSQVRPDGLSSYPENPPSHGSGQVPPRLQKKRTSAPQQVTKSSRTQASHTSHAKQTLARQQRQAHDDKRNALSQVALDIETHQDTVSGLPWNEGQSMSFDVGVPDHFVNDADMSPVDNNHILEWQLARLRQALRTSLADMESYTSYPGRLEPVITPGVPQSYPRIFVEPRPNELVKSSATPSPAIETIQHRQQQLYRQALQKQKLQIQNLLPTPPDSSSPQWSSQFSPYLTYCSTFSPELVGSTEHARPAPVSTQKFRCGASASQHPRHKYDRHEPENVNDFDSSTSIPSANTSQIVPNVNSVSSLRQSSSSSTLARYIKQLQALSPIAQLSPLQPGPSSNMSLFPLSSTDENSGPHRTVYHSPVVHTPPSPESPQTLSRGSSYHNTRSIGPIWSMQRRLSSVPEEDSTLQELSTSVSPSRLPSQLTIDSIPSSHDRAMGRQTRHVNVTRKSGIPELPEFESSLGTPCITLHHETSPVKVRLPVTRDYNIREQPGVYQEQNREDRHQHGHKKRYRYKKLKGSAATNEQATTRGLVG